MGAAIVELDKALMAACMAGNLSLALNLLSKGADIEAREMFTSRPGNSRNGQTPLIASTNSMSAESAPLALALIERGANVHASNGRKYTPLHFAARDALDTVAMALLDHGADPNATDDFGRTPLHLTMVMGHAKTGALLIERGANPDARDARGKTALHAAAQFHDASGVTKMLVEQGANVNVADSEGATPLHVAACESGVVSIDCLLDHGAEVNAVDAKGLTPLELALEVSKKLRDPVKLRDRKWQLLALIAHGADTSRIDDGDHPDLYALPAIHAAILFGSERKVLRLLKQGADVGTVHRGKSTFEVAKSANVVSLLQAWQAGQAVDKLLAQPKTSQALDP